ncbi:MAG: regulatory protein GemA [Rhizobiales bacterium]|nr:regulatory protein GemA [Hyphomicrobiales bacterium]
MASNTLLAQIHIAKKDVGMDDDTYQLFLENLTGRTSCKGMSDRMMNKVIDGFKAKGWKNSYKKKGAKYSTKAKRHTNTAKKPQAKYVFVLWRKLAELGGVSGERSALFAFCRRMTKTDDAPDGISSPDWMNTKQLNKIVEALKKMIERNKENKK